MGKDKKETVTVKRQVALDALNELRGIAKPSFKAKGVISYLQKACEEAASRCAIILNTRGADFKDRPVEEVLDELADKIMADLGISPDRHLGCSFVVVAPR